MNVEYNIQDIEPYGLCDRIHFSGFGGAARTLRVSRRPLSSILRADFPSPRGPGDLFPELDLAGGAPDDPVLFSAVWLPDGIHSYKFRYNDYAELARVELPPGGAVEYDYQSGLTNCCLSGVFKTEVYRRFVERRVYVDGDAIPESKTTYSKLDTAVTTPPSPGFTSVNYVDVDHWKPLSGGTFERILRERHYYHGNALQALTQNVGGANWVQTRYPAWRDGREFQTDSLAADGVTVLRSAKYEWQQPASVSWWTGSADTSPANNPHIAEISVTLADTNQVSKQTFQYDQYNNKTDTHEYDFGPGTTGALVRHTHIDYANTTNLINGIDYTTSDATTGVQLLGLPTQQQVFDAAGILRAQTRYEYDNYNQTSFDVFHYSLTPRSNISGLDGSFTTTYHKRGNVTKSSRYLLDTNGNVIGSVDGYAQYDIAGNVVKVIDPRSTATIIIATSFDFADRFGSPDTEAQSNLPPSELGTLMSYAFPTKVTNAQGHVGYMQYDYYLGASVNNEDANGIVSSTEYGNEGLDLLDRPSKIIRAINSSIKSQTSFAYNDVNHIITTTSDLIAYGDSLLKSETVYDGLGRTTERRQYETATNYITVKQTYDALGRASQTSNPYRGGDTVVWTTTTYDALSRVSSVATPDNAVASTSYSGNSVTVTDQTGKKRKSATDALGRLKEVYEDPAGQNWLTSYSHDVLDDLTTVAQGSQTRTFAYDSLKRLTSATNPESGTVSYQYDNNGNLIQKSDARTVVTNYIYDSLNRITSRSYTMPAGLPATPTVTYVYDDPLATNSKGRLTKVNSNVSSYSYSSYDALGRVLGGTQTTDGNPYAMSYSYDLAGNLKTQTYPSGRVAITEYDNAGRIAGVKNQANINPYYAGGSPVSTESTYGNRIQYAAHGAMSQVRLGNGLWEHTNFNSRLQLTQIGLGTAIANSSVLQLDFNYGTTNNNGNLQSQTITVPGLALTQSYTYDDLNRLESAREVRQGTPCFLNAIGTTDCWKQTFSYDRYGNRRFDAGQTTEPVITASNQNNTNPTISDADNRISAAGYRYDAAGNLECDPAHPCASTTPFPPYYTYDGENRMKEANGGTASGGATYSYDGDGRRVKKFIGMETIVFAYNIMGKLVAEYTNSAPSGWAGTSYLTADHLGTPRVITKQDQSLKIRRDYMPFGEEISAAIGGRAPIPGYALPSDTRQQFTSKERDNETGLDYSINRYYSSVQGRFTSVDPSLASARTAAPQSWNRYSYSINNPLKYTDPNGLDWWYNTKVQHPTPVWFDSDPGGDWKRWTDTYSYVYQAGNGIWAALDPKGNRAFISNSPDRAAQQFAAFVEGESGLISGSQADRDFSGGVAEGLSPLGPIIALFNASNGLDITSRDYKAGLLTGVLLSAGISAGSGVVNSIRELTPSSAGVAAAEKALKNGATEVHVNSSGEAAEIYLRNFQHEGYRNTTGMTGNEVRNDKFLFPQGKNGTYHWDLADTQHGGQPHLQVQTADGTKVRIFFPVGSN